VQDDGSVDFELPPKGNKGLKPLVAVNIRFESRKADILKAFILLFFESLKLHFAQHKK
jgi:hypothetical protein